MMAERFQFIEMGSFLASSKFELFFSVHILLLENVVSSTELVITLSFTDSPSPVVVSLTPSNKSSSGGKPPAPPLRPRFSESEVKAMTSKKYMDALVVPTLLKAMAAVNKQVSENGRSR